MKMSAPVLQDNALVPIVPTRSRADAEDETQLVSLGFV